MLFTNLHRTKGDRGVLFTIALGNDGERGGVLTNPQRNKVEGGVLQHKSSRK